jgi:DnaJ-class molecular chaperone
MAIIEKKPIRFSNVDVCRNCKGRGEFEMLSTKVNCPICQGKGRVKVTKEIRITVETIS